MILILFCFVYDGKKALFQQVIVSDGKPCICIEFNYNITAAKTIDFIVIIGENFKGLVAFGYELWHFKNKSHLSSYWYLFLFSILKCHNRSFKSYGSSKIHKKPNCLSEIKRLSKDIEKIDKSRNQFHILWSLKCTQTQHGRPMVIK